MRICGVFVYTTEDGSASCVMRHTTKCVIARRDICLLGMLYRTTGSLIEILDGYFL